MLNVLNVLLYHKNSIFNILCFNADGKGFIMLTVGLLVESAVIFFFVSDRDCCNCSHRVGSMLNVLLCHKNSIFNIFCFSDDRKSFKMLTRFVGEIRRNFFLRK